MLQGSETPHFSVQRRIWVLSYLVQQELLLGVASHCAPDSHSLWKAEESQAVPCVCWPSTLPAPLGRCVTVCGLGWRHPQDSCSVPQLCMVGPGDSPVMSADVCTSRGDTDHHEGGLHPLPEAHLGLPHAGELILSGKSPDSL